MAVDFYKHKKGDVVRVHCCDDCARRSGVQPKSPPDSGIKSWLCEVCGHFGIGSATDCTIGDWLRLQPNALLGQLREDMHDRCEPIATGPLARMVEALPPPDVRCCFNCTKWHKKGYIHCQRSGPWGGDIFGDKNCVFRAKKVRSNTGGLKHERLATD